jgi:two-component system cell cycle sensor histidine kinase/response regulator CckA
VDAHGVITLWNSAAERAYGYSAQEIVGRRLAILWPGSAAVEPEEPWDRFRSGGSMLSRPTRMRHRDGHGVPVSLSLYQVKDEAGTLVGTTLVAHELDASARPDVDRGGAASQQAVLTQAPSASMLLAFDTTGTIALAQGETEAREGSIVGSSVYDVLAWIPDARASVMHALSGTESDTSGSFAGRSLRFDFRATYNADGQIIGGTVSVLDLTEQRAAEESLHAYEARFDALLRHSFDAVIVIGADAVINDVYVGGGRAFGFTREDMLGRVGWEFIHPDDHGLVAAAWERALTVRGPQPPIEFRMLMSDDTWGWAEEVISNVLDDPAVGSLVINIRDITQRHRAEEALIESEQRYRRAVHSSPDAIAIVDGRGNVSLANPNLGTLLGCDANELVGRKYDALGLPEPANHDGDTPAAYHSRDGSVRWLEVTSAPLHHSADGLHEHLIWIHDVTDRRALQDRLVEAERMEAIGRFAGGAVHDFNNVLQVIRGQTDLLGHSVPMGTDAEQDVAGLSEAVEQAVGLVGQLMAFAKGQTLDPVDVDLNRRLERLQDFCRRLLPPRIVLDLVPASGATLVHVDPTQLDRVVVNLVTNARDATEGDGRIVIETHVGVMLDAKAPAVGFSVTDSGCGMSADVVARCFEPFFTTKVHGLGTGLGLSTSYGIVQQSGGSMHVQSSEGQGTRVTILLPLSTTTEPSRQSDSLEQAPRAPQDVTILVVDDDPGVRLFAQQVLSDVGYSVVSADSAETADTVLETLGHPVDILLTDVHMPGENGFDLARRLHARGVVMRPSILMSGFTVDLTAGDSSGVHPLPLPKPFGATELLVRVSQSLGRS